MTSYLLVVSIGPVQSFIQTARTTRDLAFGSRALSELAKAVAMWLQQQGAELIFPAPQSADLKPWTDFNATNQIVAVMKGDPAAIVQKVRQHLQQHLQDWFAQALQALPSQQRAAFQQHPAHARALVQLEHFLEIYWAAAEMAPSGNYAQARARALAALRLRKNTRDFAVWPGVAGVPKSALDGFREAVIVVVGTQNKNTCHIRRYRKEDRVFLLNENPPRFKEGEALSGVDVLKRLGGYGLLKSQDVPSTSDMAAKPLIARLDKQKVQAWKQTLVKALTTEFQVNPRIAESETDGVYFFPERVANLITGENEYERRAQFHRRFQALWKPILGEDTPAPHPYYALLIADGDGMGEIIDARKTKEAHQELSRKITTFAKQARQIIQTHGGFPVYIGGDDIVALFPLHTVLEALKALDEKFCKLLEKFTTAQGRKPTLSGGLVIAHHLMPLEEMLAKAREAEAYAKEKPGKHALTMVLLHRGGEAVRVRDTWPDLVQHLCFWADLAQRGLFPRGLPYDLQRLAEFLEPTDLPVAGYQAEVKRIFKQKRERKDEKAWAVLEEQVNARFQGVQDKEAAQILVQMAHEMRLALEIATVGAIAQVKPCS